ncbi:MAG: hypothetical protein VX498_15650, partial [Myxococcota bacterium]|nr:hypothetical protein [Myxococcota bacterium]
MHPVRAFTLALVLAFGGPAMAGDTEVGSTEASEGDGLLGNLTLDVSPRTRVAAIGEFEGGLFRLGLWRHDVPVAPQVVASKVPVLVTFNTVPLGKSGVRLDLRLDPKVQGVAVVRSSSDTVEIHFSAHTFAGSKVRLQARRDIATRAEAANQQRDQQVAAILDLALVDPPGWVDWDPITWPIGGSSPLRPRLRASPEPHPFGRIPPAVRRGWNASPILARSVELANQGRLIEASQALAGIPTKTDLARALLALARAYVWSQPDSRGEPVDPGRAGQSYVLAAALVPDAPWAAWARGQAGYNLSRAFKFHDAVYQYEKAIDLAPGDEERVYWDVGCGLALIQAGKDEEGVLRLVNSLGGLPESADGLRFTGRRAIAHNLWTNGEYSRAARLADLVIKESPGLARNPRLDERWARIYLDSGRPSAAIPFLERLQSEGKRKVIRERARWWLHEAALAQRDTVQSRRWLRELIQGNPASTLGPQARLRLRVLDSVESRGVGLTELSYPAVALELRTEALRWPNGPVEDEALSLAAQFFFAMGMLEDGLQLYRWVQRRTPGSGGAIAYQKIICEMAPLAFDE